MIFLINIDKLAKALPEMEEIAKLLPDLDKVQENFSFFKNLLSSGESKQNKTVTPFLKNISLKLKLFYSMSQR